MVTLVDTEDREGVMHPCNGYVLVQKMEERSDLLVVHFTQQYQSAIVVESSHDETEPLEVKSESHEWIRGDLIYFRDCIEVDGHMFVHWTDVIAYRRFNEEDGE